MCIVMMNIVLNLRIAQEILQGILFLYPEEFHICLLHLQQNPD